MARLEMLTSRDKPRCQARLTDSAFFINGPGQCENAAKPGEAFCGTHMRVLLRRVQGIKRRGTRAAD